MIGSEEMKRGRWRGRTWSAGLAALALAFVVPAVPAQQTAEPAPRGEDVPAPPPQVAVENPASDTAIEERLAGILKATGWFSGTTVRVEQGVVFLEGTADNAEHRDWAGRLAGQTEDVVAVVNNLEAAAPVVQDLSPAWDSLRSIAAGFVRSLPLIGLALALLILAWFLAVWTRRGTAAVFRRRMRSSLLAEVSSRAAAVPVFLLGLYVVLKLSGLSGLAATVLGGTGLMGLIIGFAFRDIAENFLASILLSMQRPFATGDLIEVAGFKGYVQSVNTRSTLLMTMQGNHVQIPNATIYKESITNFTANPYERFDFGVGIGYDDSISQAQSVALKVLTDHPAVRDDPEPLVLAEALGAATVNLRVYFWIDISQFSGLKVRSAVIRLVKKAFQQARISMPDEAREIVFPSGVPVRMLAEDEMDERPADRPEPPERKSPASAAAGESATAHSAEGGFATEAGEIEEQARKARLPEGGTNLLES